MNKIFIIAGNYEQYGWFFHQLKWSMEDNGIPYKHNDFVYLDNPDKIRGIRDPWGYKVGTWNERKDIEQISIMLLTAGSSIDNFIEAKL